MKIAISGVTGLIGNALLLKLLKNDNDVIALVRSIKKYSNLPCKEVVFNYKDKRNETELFDTLKNTDIIIHLAGEPVASSRWTQAKKNKILESRVMSTQYLVGLIQRMNISERPKLFICASASGFYGDRSDETLTETSSVGQGFLSEVTYNWEKSALTVKENGVRTLILRFGIILSNKGGALDKMQPTILGNGKQWMSWMHIDDVINAIEFLIHKNNAEGTFNFSTPNPVQNKDFTKAFAKAIGFPITPSVPKIFLKTILGELSTILLDSQKMIPKRLMELNYPFKFSTINDAFEDIYKNKTKNEKIFHSSVLVPRTTEEVFSFFSSAENLEKITPPFLNFKIISISSKEMQKGTLITYKLKIHGIPIKWVTEIVDWQKNNVFADNQLKGPYSKWLHYHKFYSIKEGTLMEDYVEYKIPFGLIGSTLLGNFIRKDIESIFEFRTKVIKEIFK